MAQRLFPSLPRIKVPIGHIPQRLKSPVFTNPQGNLEVLRKMVNRLIREERCEFKYNRAEECRQYAERLIQLGVYRGLNDNYTKEMFEWWLIEKDVHEKMIEQIIPRFSEAEEPYTLLYQLPKVRLPHYINLANTHWAQWDLGILELKGNPFPSIEHLEIERQNRMKEIVGKALKFKN